MSINLTDELLAKTKKGKIASAKQVFLEGDQENLQQIGDKTHQLEDAIKDITVSGGASTANAVSYNNETSGMTAVTAQGAIDELAAKNKTQDTIIEAKAEKSEVATELDKKFDKENIAQEFGDSEDKVVSQSALPFRYIQNEEFIFAKVDANDKLLFGIEWDGTPVFGKTSAVEDRLQAQVNLLADKITSILGDDDTTSAIDTLKELKDFFASIDNTQTLTSILANLNSVSTKLGEDIKNLQDTKVDKEEGKSLIEDEVKECFRIIENEEFIKAIVDSDDKVLFGFYRATGKPYYPLNEMYHVIQNEEFFAAWVTTDDKVVLGLRRDGEIIGEIHAVNTLKQVFSQLQSDLASLQEKVGTIDSNLKELLDVFSLQENPEYMAVEKDADGRVLSATYNDGSHYIHNAKSETIPEEFSHIEDLEGRTEITTDAEDKILGYRDSEGTRHEHKISAKHIELSDEAATEVSEAFKSAGIKMENPSDFSKDSHIELPIPRIAAQVRLYAPKLPTTKQDDIEAEIEYNDKDGNYFRKPVILNAQGSSSMGYYVKNMAIDIADGSEIKFGDFPTQDSFHLKKYYIDIFRGQCVVAYWLMEQVYKSRPAGQQYPYEYSYSNESVTDGTGDVKKDFITDGKCHPDGFPIVITWIDNEGKETYMGVYTWNLKKSKEVYNADKKKAENIILDGVISSSTLFGGTIKWEQFEIRNPKSLKDIDGNNYDGDNPKELSDTDKNSKKVKDYLTRLSGVVAALASSNTKETFEKYFLVNPFIDYFLVSQVIYHLDGFRKNWIWLAYNGEKWCPSLYDTDSIFGSHWTGTYVVKNSDKATILGINECMGLTTLYASEIKDRYKFLREQKIFDVDNIVSLLDTWVHKIGYENIKKECALYKETPSYRASLISDGWDLLAHVNSYHDGSPTEYDANKTYLVGEICKYRDYVFKATKSIQGVAPCQAYDKNPYCGGYFNSVKRVRNWLKNRIEFLDKTYINN